MDDKAIKTAFTEAVRELEAETNGRQFPDNITTEEAAKHVDHDVVVAWAMACNCSVKATDEKLRAMVVPTKEGWRLRFHHMGVEREILAGQFRETHTQVDPELEARSILPVERRRGLGKPLRVPVMMSGERVLR